MAISPTDFEKIWASNSPLTPYTFSDANYEQGWNFVGSTPPARQMWDSYMKLSDDKQKYLLDNTLPLTGGTLTGNLTISKSEPNLVLGNSDLTRGTIPASNTLVGRIKFGDQNDSYLQVIRCYLDTDGNSRLELGAYRNASTAHVTVLQIVDTPSGTDPCVQANNDNVVTLGTSDRRWKELYAGTATINTSDERLKDNIETIPDDVLDAWGDVKWNQFQFKDSLKEKGESARLHTGLIAQRIDTVFKSHGLDASKYGLFCHDSWDATEESKDEDGNVMEEARPAGDLYSLRYEEALCMECAYQRRRADRLEARIKALEDKIAL